MNTMRQEYKVLSVKEKDLVLELKTVGQQFWNKLDGIGSSRELSVAKTKIEEAVMWAIKHVTA